MRNCGDKTKETTCPVSTVQTGRSHQCREGPISQRLAVAWSRDWTVDSPWTR